MFTLLKFEIKKLLTSKILWICMFFSVFLCVVYGMLMVTDSSSSDWKNEYSNTIVELKDAKEDLEIEIRDMLTNNENVDIFYYNMVSSMEEMIIKYEYAIENNIQIEQTSRIQFLTRVMPIVSFSCIFLFLILAATAIVSEVSNGKIRSLLLRPINRDNIFNSKYFSIFFTSLIFFAVIFCSLYLFSIFYFDNMHNIDLVVENGIVKEINLVDSLSISVINLLLNLMIFETLAFSFSVFFNRSIFSLAFSTSLYIGLQFSNIVIFNLKCYKYLPIKMIDVSSLFNNIQIPIIFEFLFFDIVIVFIFVSIIIILAKIIFLKKDF